MVLMVMVEVVLVLGTPTSTTQRNMFDKSRIYLGFQKSHHECTKSPMGLLRSRDYIVGAYDYSSVGVGDGDGKYGVVHRTNHYYSYRDYCWLGGGDFVLSKIRDDLAMVAGYDRGGVGTKITHFSSQKFVLKRVWKMGGLFILRMSAHHKT